MKRTYDAATNADEPAPPNLEPGASLHMLQRMSAGTGQDGATRWLMTRDLDEFAQTHTPYGTLLTTVKLPLVSGDDYDWPVVAPAPLLWLLCRKCPRFSKLVQSCADLDGQADW